MWEWGNFEMRVMKVGMRELWERGESKDWRREEKGARRSGRGCGAGVGALGVKRERMIGFFFEGEGWVSGG